jgi:hypothetical protein
MIKLKLKRKYRLDKKKTLVLYYIILYEEE